jgi:hypothetical protein
LIGIKLKPLVFMQLLTSVAIILARCDPIDLAAAMVGELG